MLAACLTGHAANIEFKRADVQFADNQAIIFALPDIKLPPPLEEALHRGLPLPFVYEFRLSGPNARRWYKHLGSWLKPTARIDFRLTHHTLTGGYHLSSGSLNRSFDSLSDALAALSSLYGWIAVKQLPSTKIDTLAGLLRLRLDQSQLPKHYQLTALGAEQWRLDSGWVDLKTITQEGYQ